ncbi:hypothetical protein GOQ27_13960 [Clostridium sp. D2Q-11]|uniref:Uncharacterized protein n=1 Tax=Anaeromonas frigoriresistens TaxID=2683708 RepID=A0A942UXU1_9FIRM|nr:hypothetical protein [Anaeromonas frigoriresistens]MBS4539575.1 hypothetical protein [Anaeromonas frigoriresistens]
MKSRSLAFLILSLAISSGTSLIDRYIVPIPNWLSIVLIFLAATSLIYSISLYIRKVRQS